MTGRTGQDHLVREERLEGHRALATRRAHDAELELALGYLRDHGLRVGYRELHLHLWALALKFAEEQRHGDGRRPGRGADLEPPADRLVVPAGHLLHQLLLELDQPLRSAVEPKARLGGDDAAPGAVE